jgi:hypothetical protein
MQKPDPIPCSAGCKREMATMDEALQASWELLPISNHWRCPQCTRELKTINTKDDVHE